MKKTVLATLSATLLSLGVYAASDRLDLYTKAGSTFLSIMVDDIKEISYLPNETNDGFDKVKVQTIDGEDFQFDLNEVSHIQYQQPSDEFLEISRVGDEHARVVMLDCINNEGIMDPNKSEDWTAERAGGLPHFITDVELGFDAVHIVTGKYTGKVYTDIPGYVYILPADDDTNLYGCDCWTFEMPNEPVEIKLVSTERTTYNGMPFLGTYTGYPVTVAENRIFKSSEETQFSIVFKGNETYKIETSDSNNFSFTDLYYYNEESNSFEYQYFEPTRLSYHDTYVYGANGKFFDNDVIIDIHNLSIDKAENITRYFGSKANVNYTCAALDEYGYQYLIEVTDTENNTTKWYFLDNYGYIKKEATVEFISGNTIANACEAKVSYDNEVHFKYVLTNGQFPLYIEKGKEAGTYASSDDTNTEMTLDGFGEAKIGENTYAYEIESGIITINIEGSLRIFLIDTNAMTYTETHSEEWDGAISYLNESVLGAYYNSAETNTKNRVEITFDYNLVGKEKPGYAAISVDLYRNPGLSNGVADCQRYLYLKDAKLLIITNVLTGTASGQTIRQNLVFTVSDDKTALYIAGEGEETKIYSTTGGYVVADINNQLVGELPKPVELADKYTAQAKFDFMGTLGDANVDIDIDADINGSAKEGFAAIKVSAMGTNAFHECVEYTVKRSTLTLKSVTVGDGNYGTQTVDIVFTVNEDGTLTGSGEYYGCDMTTAFMKIILNDVIFEPIFKTIELADKYTAQAKFDYMNMLGDANVDIDIDADIDGSAKEGFATIKVSAMGTNAFHECVEYTLEGSVLTLKSVTVGDGNYGTQTVDIVFTVNEDETLTGSGEYYGIDMTTAMMKIILNDVIFNPVTE